MDICYFMKGGLQWNDAWSLSFSDREKLVKRINKHRHDESGSTKEYM
jgi:hypothetical protein